MDFDRAQLGTDLCEHLRSVAAPIFAAVENSAAAGLTLTVHVASVPRQRDVKAQILTALAGCTAQQIRIRFHRASNLLAPRSLERLVKRFGSGKILYDPTGAIERARSMVAAGCAVRASLGSRACGVYYAPRLRTMFVALNAKQIAVGEKFRVGALAEVERAVHSAIRDSFRLNMADCPAIRVGFGLPKSELVAIDQRSVAGWGARIVRAVRRYWTPIAVATLFGLGASTAAAKDPAVSQTNLKITSTGGVADSDSAWFVNGALTTPVNSSWGLQIEGAAAGADSDTTYGAAGHLFTRDPESYLLGLFAAYASEDEFNLDATRVGAEAELYLKQISILVDAGYQFSDTVGDTAFGEIELRWYVSDNFVLSGGGSFDEQSSIARAGVEWQPGFSALPGLAFRVDGAVGDNDYDSIMGGITYYFGADASLKDRHRKQDPASVLLGLMSSVEQEKQRLCALYGCATEPQ
ncbi:MAG: hypothetical protein K8S25_06790 [Alphaproteobacteria bacterium]|nr:hypothetical protein [Alphaproteobacteria bacterium]